MLDSVYDLTGMQDYFDKTNMLPDQPGYLPPSPTPGLAKAPDTLDWSRNVSPAPFTTTQMPPAPIAPPTTTDEKEFYKELYDRAIRITTMYYPKDSAFAIALAHKKATDWLEARRLLEQQKQGK
jgi:hypothetical protein